MNEFFWIVMSIAISTNPTFNVTKSSETCSTETRMETFKTWNEAHTKAKSLKAPVIPKQCEVEISTTAIQPSLYKATKQRIY